MIFENGKIGHLLSSFKSQLLGFCQSYQNDITDAVQ
jgi:hypothetical protein